MLKRPDDATKPAIAASHALLTGAWTVYVKAMEEALGRLGMDRGAAEDCRVKFFEVAGDDHLHVNITNGSATAGVEGWSGPATTADGVVYNRIFDHMPRYQLLRQLKHMIFASPS